MPYIILMFTFPYLHVLYETLFETKFFLVRIRKTCEKVFKADLWTFRPARKMLKDHDNW